MKISRLGLAITIIAVVMISIIGCREPETIEVPDPRPVTELYQWLIADKESNSGRSKEREKKGEVYSFEGSISEIDNGKVRFHVEDRPAARDTWLECEFANDRSTLSLDTGQVVRLYGSLDKVDRVVKFGDCRFYDNLK